jgi:hypothetical protein
MSAISLLETGANGGKLNLSLLRCHLVCAAVSHSYSISSMTKAWLLPFKSHGRKLLKVTKSYPWLIIALPGLSSVMLWSCALRMYRDGL